MPEQIRFPSVKGSLPRTHGILNLSPLEAQSYLEKGAVLVDLREAYETNFRVFDLPDVIYLPWTVFAASLSCLPRNRPLVLADASGIYCREAAGLLVSAGYDNVAKLSGGMIDWDAAGLPVRKDLDFELRGQCACKLKTRDGANPLLDKHVERPSTEATFPRP